ncbi:MAG: ABC transporter ATP-binding protein [Porticoccaceae bacterium]|jgi:ABC-2 type transport system ATP-binding protein|nr:ABC transporter ATP-binding protein [Porticoccaceae bacterium]
MTAALSISNLSKTYNNGFEALKGIDLTVEQGDFFALLGPNGAGKSTTIGILCSLVRKSAGQVEVFGTDIDQNFPKAKQHIGIVPQEFNFNAWEKVFDIVVTQGGYYGMPLPLAKERAEKYLKKLGLWEKRDQSSRTLSGGMKRRLMIARALVHEPNLLILDEPTAGVDIELRRSMWEFLKEINAAGTTIILTTHYLEEAESLCRNVAIIDQGNIIRNSSVKSLLRELNKETFIIDFEEEFDSEPNLPGYQPKLVDTSSLEVVVEKGTPLNDLFRQLDAEGLHVRSMRNKSNRLEEMFVSMLDANKEKQQSDSQEQGA